MTQSTDDEIGAALGRLNRRAARTYEIVTDGIEYRPSRVIEELASELGFAPNRPRPEEVTTVDDLYPPFVRDPKRADGTRDYRRRTFLRVLALAGGDPDDIAAVQQAFGLEPRDSDFADRIDDHNAQVRQHWIDEFQRQQAVALANARRDEHRRTVEQVHAELNSDAPPPDLSGPSMTISSAYYAESGQTVTVRGVLAGVSKRITKQGRDWASATVRDGRSQIEVLVFPNRYESAEALLVDGTNVVVTGRLDRHDGPAQITAASVQVDEPAEKTAYTLQQLTERLEEFAADTTQSGALRLCARYAAAPNAEEQGFAVRPADLSNDAIREALSAQARARHDEGPFNPGGNA